MQSNTSAPIVKPNNGSSLKTEDTENDTLLLLTYAQLARQLSVTVQTLYVWVRENRIRPIKIGRLSRFDPQDVVKRLKKGTNVSR